MRDRSRRPASIQMIDGKYCAPLSPPNSPRMSDIAVKSGAYQWQQPQSSMIEHPPSLLPLPVSTYPGYTLSHDIRGFERESARPSLTLHNAVHPPGAPSSQLQHGLYQDRGVSYSQRDARENELSREPQPISTSDLPSTMYGASVPTSPTGRLTPHSPDDVGDAQTGDEETGDGDDPAGEEEEYASMTPAEIRASKRKMKRFRLTHNQTRYLTGEFVRQPHPDAAHRERLSREIPGLSPRQVQVWFQNRRAKLKRLTAEDRERMMRSRALPANFDMTQALHAPYGTQPQGVGANMASQGAFPSSYIENGGIRPLTLDTLRRVPDYDQYSQQYTSHAGIASALGSFSFTPPQSATDGISNSSGAGNASSFGYQAQDTPQRHAFGPSMATPSAYAPHLTQMHRPPFQDRFQGPIGESASSPLRTSISFSGSSSDKAAQAHPQDRAASFSAQSSSAQSGASQHRSPIGQQTSSAAPYGSGFTYAPMSNAPLSEQQSTPRSATMPSTDAHLPYRRGSEHYGALGHYQTPGFATPHAPQYATYAQYNNQAYAGQDRHHFTPSISDHYAQTGAQQTNAPHGTGLATLPPLYQ